MKIIIEAYALLRVYLSKYLLNMDNNKPAVVKSASSEKAKLNTYLGKYANSL